jgi:nicotinate-nucleotide adenylyltransferase
MAAMKRVGIFGGSFDPVHRGHLMVAYAAREEVGLDRLIFVPANRSPFKPQQTPATSALRMKMLRLALAGLEWCSVSDLELRRPGVSYTIDTVRSLQEQVAAAAWFLLIGEDHLAALRQWRDADELMQRVEFLVVPRPGTPLTRGETGVKSHRLAGWPVQISSSDIRRRVRDGLTVDHLVPTAVAEVIRHNGLYLR